MSKRQIIRLTLNAENQITNILKNAKKRHIRFSIKGGGCNGFNYDLKPTNNQCETTDEIVRFDNFEMHICHHSLLHLLGTNIDWKNDIMEQKFIFDNPMARTNCGCGTSFASKMLCK